MINKIILIAGRTGGPILPLLAIYNKLSRNYSLEGIIVGVRGGYEEKVASENGLTLRFLPETKLRSLPKYKNMFNLTIFGLETFGTLIILVYSVFSSLLIILRYKPRIVLSAGSFLAVPMIYAAKIANWLFFQKIKIVVHQQDPSPGLANRLTIKLADLKSYVFDYTQEHYPQFSSALQIPNPLNISQFNSEIMMQTALEIAESKPALHLFFRNLSPDKPLLLIFGGASGAEKINDWVAENLVMLKSRFSILHLTGALQNKEYQLMETQGYLSVESLNEKEMRLAESVCDLCLCRAGLGSISELLFLQKPAYLVPIPDSHQIINAEQVREYFYILDQNSSNEWLSKIFTTYPKFFAEVDYPDVSQTEARLDNYYAKIRQFLNS